MAFRATFDCLWCGTSHSTRTPDDVEGWAALCPECLGNAQDNGFLKMRLRTALADRARANSVADPAPSESAPAAPAPATAHSAAAPASGGVAPPPVAGPPPDHDDFYLRKGRYSRGPLHDGPWSMSLDEVTSWLDGLPIDGTIVELDAGTGWWSGLLAEKGELWVYDRDDAALEAARKRLVAHGLMAHLHQRGGTAEPDKSVAVLFGAYLLGRHGSPEGVARQLDIVSRWLKPGGLVAIIEAASPQADQGRIPGPGGDVRTWTSGEVEEVLTASDYEEIEVRTAGSAFVMASARRPRLEP